MHRFLSRSPLLLLLILAGALSPQPGSAQTNERDVDYIINRYLDAMGGRAALERIRSVRLSGHVQYPNGARNGLTVIKKKPNFVRVSIDTGTIRFIQAYDGETAWFARQAGKQVFYDHIRGKNAGQFIREAPLENILLRRSSSELNIFLGEDISLAGTPCYQVFAELPDGGKVVHFIEKETFLERRILQYDEDDALVSEIIPGKFRNVEGVMFATQIIRLVDGKPISTVLLDDVAVNVGILNSAFECPVELPEK